jgi:hypothetical protein
MTTLLPADLDTERALALFDGLPAVRAEEITGARYRGAAVPTGHPLEAVLGAAGWYGKEFQDLETVHPLLVTAPDGKIFPLDPARLPLGLVDRLPADRVPPAATRRLIGAARPVLRARVPGARLRNLEYRGVVSAAMIYDAHPIIDVFRRLDEHTLLGAMDRRDDPRPAFFTLTRD